MEYTYPIEGWREIFKNFTQVIQVQADFSAERLDLTIKDRKGTLQATQNELDDALYKYNCNPKEVAIYFLRKHNIITFYQDTLVGFFDIVGYSSFVEKNQNHFEKCILKISNFFDGTANTSDTDIGTVKFDHWILSDSIILVIDTNRNPISFASLALFFATCSEIMRYGMINGFPLRGAIGGGDFYKDGEILVSTALVNAANYEKKQEWLGAVLTPEAHQIMKQATEFNISDLDSNDNFTPFVRYGKIPWKTKEACTLSKEAYYIKPFGMSEKDWAKKHLPNYFNKKDAEEKIKYSHILYAEE